MEFIVNYLPLFGILGLLFVFLRADGFPVRKLGLKEWPE